MSFLVTACLSLSGASTAPPSKIRALVVSGQNNHDWQWTTPSLRRMLESTGRFDVDVTFAPAETLADAEALGEYHVLVLDYNGEPWGEPAEGNFLSAVARGTGVAVIHAANNAFPGWVEYEKLVGHCWREGTGHGRFHAFDVVVQDHDHPVTRELPDLVDHPDELYHRLVHMHDAPFRLLASAHSDAATGGTGEEEPMVLTLEYGRGRVFHTPLGHVWPGSDETRASHEDPQFQRLVQRGVEWAATGEVQAVEGQPNRLSEAERDAGWELLFDGQSTDAWRGYRGESFPSEGWVVDDGALKTQGGGGDIITRAQYADFELTFDWRIAPGANSGVMYRVAEDEPASWQTGPEYQVLDDEAHFEGANTNTSAASLYALYVAEKAHPFPPGQYNRGRIVLRDGRVEHWLNGRKVVDCEWGSDDWKARVAASKFGTMPGFASKARGHIALQDHGDEVWYRNLKVRSLD